MAVFNKWRGSTLAAGALGTQEILFASRYRYRTLPKLSVCRGESSQNSSMPWSASQARARLTVSQLGMPYSVMVMVSRG